MKKCACPFSLSRCSRCISASRLSSDVRYTCTWCVLYCMRKTILSIFNLKGVLRNIPSGACCDVNSLQSTFFCFSMMEETDSLITMFTSVGRGSRAGQKGLFYKRAFLITRGAHWLGNEGRGHQTPLSRGHF